MSSFFYRACVASCGIAIRKCCDFFCMSVCQSSDLWTLSKSINQSIKTDLYSDVCRKRIRGARWKALGGVSSVKQLRL